jgi:hypothetical protein
MYCAKTFIATRENTNTKEGNIESADPYPKCSNYTE